MNEFTLIKQFFTDRQPIQRADVLLGISDDGAIVKAPANQDLVITTDTLIEGVHFPKHTSAFDVGYKALAVNLSDLAAMGATPAWMTLALTLPSLDKSWLEGFSQGLFALAARYHVQLIGGDTTKGPHLTVTIQAHGLTPCHQALRRDKAKVGDLIYVTGTLGDAAAAIHLLQKEQEVPEELLQRLNRPEPRVAIGEQLRNAANAAIDISDGLAADLGHILEQSNVGAKLYVDQIPLSRALCDTVSREDAIAFALNGGDDYELCFTAPKNGRAWPGTCVGEITSTPGLEVNFADGRKYTKKLGGYQHF